MKGLYLIKRDDGAIYFGKSMDIVRRVKAHKCTKRFRGHKIVDVLYFDVEKHFGSDNIEGKLWLCEILCLQLMEKTLDSGKLLNIKKESGALSRLDIDQCLSC